MGLTDQRELLKLTQEQLAGLSGVSLRVIRDMEQGIKRPTAQAMANLQTALNNFAQDANTPDAELLPVEKQTRLRGDLSLPQWATKNPWAAALMNRREFMGYTQQVLADESSVSICTIRNIEQGRSVPGPLVRRKLAAALKIDTAELWGVPGQYKNIKNPLQVARLKAGWNRTVCARLIGIHRSTLIKVEQNNLSLSDATYLTVAGFLGITIWQLKQEIRASIK